MLKNAFKILTILFMVLCFSSMATGTEFRPMMDVPRNIDKALWDFLDRVNHNLSVLIGSKGSGDYAAVTEDEITTTASDIQYVSVSSLASPGPEISPLGADQEGNLLVAYKSSDYTIYAFRGVAASGSSPYVVDAVSGKWVAVAGTYVAKDTYLAQVTASRIVSTTSTGKLSAVSDLASWIAGTADEVNVTDDADGTVTIGIADPLIVAKGGTGSATLTDHGILLGSGTDAITPLGSATDGQLPIGSTGADPVLATITGTANEITIANAAGSITASIPLGLTLKTGTTSFAPLNFQSGPVRTTPAAGAMEFLGDILYFTTTTGPTRKEIPYSDTDYGGMYSYDKAVSLFITVKNVYHGYYAVAAGDIVTGLTDGWTFDAGRNVDANITSEADTGGQLRIVNSAAHNLTAGDIVIITNANNAAHNTATRVSFDATNPTTEFICDDISYVAGAGASAAIVDEPAYLQVTSAVSQIYHLSWSMSGNSAVANKEYKFEPVQNITHLDNCGAQVTFGNTTANSVSGQGLVSVNTGDRIWMQCENLTDGTNFVVKHFNMVLSRQ
jgi:hypothetical protein